MESMVLIIGISEKFSNLIFQKQPNLKSAHYLESLICVVMDKLQLSPFLQQPRNLVSLLNNYCLRHSTKVHRWKTIKFNTQSKICHFYRFLINLSKFHKNILTCL